MKANDKVRVYSLLICVVMTVGWMFLLGGCSEVKKQNTTASGDATSSEKHETNASDNTSILEQKKENEPKRFQIDPFIGLKVDFFGISPFCTVAVNNAGCTPEAQQYVTYEVEGSYFAKGDVVTVKATLHDESGAYEIRAGREQAEFTVKDVPYYIESLDGLDLTFIKKELSDYIIAQTSFESKWEVFGVNAVTFMRTYGDGGNSYCDFFNVSSTKSTDAYIISLKPRCATDFLEGEKDVYNSLRIIAACTAEASHQNSHSQWYTKGDIYVCFKLDNIIAYPDGTFGWGKSAPESCLTTYSASLQGRKALSEETVTAYMDNYNVNVLDQKDWINITD